MVEQLLRLFEVARVTAASAAHVAVARELISGGLRLPPCAAAMRILDIRRMAVWRHRYQEMPRMMLRLGGRYRASPALVVELCATRCLRAAVISLLGVGDAFAGEDDVMNGFACWVGVDDNVKRVMRQSCAGV